MSKKDNAPKHLHEHEETKFDSSTLVKMLKQLLPMIDKAKELLGWTPSTKRKDGLKRTVEYFKSNLN